MKKCRLCHGKDLFGKKRGSKETPPIAGMKKAKLLKALNTPPKQMKAVAKGLTDDQKAKIADVISKMKAKAKAKP